MLQHITKETTQCNMLREQCYRQKPVCYKPILLQATVFYFMYLFFKDIFDIILDREQ